MEPAPSLPAAGDRVDRYEVLTPVARGGMAAVYAVRRSSLGGFDKLLAMKFMLPQVCSEPQIVNLFLDEARIAATVSHPNVVQVLDVGGTPEQPFIVMEYLRGQSLSRVMRRAAPLPASLVLHVAALAAEGLHAAHEAVGTDGMKLGIVHRDISPQNIVVTYQGDVKVVDFGIAAARGRLTETRTGEVRGKLSYLPPEALTKSAPLDRRADVWAMAVVVWELLANRPLFRGEDEASTLWNVVHEPIEDIAAHCPDLPRAASEAVMKGLERQLDLRLPDCQALAEALHEAADELPPFRRSDLVAFMARHFATEAAAERTRLTTAIEDVPTRPDAPPQDETALEIPAPNADAVTQVTAEATVDADSPSPNRYGWGVAAAVALGVALLTWRMQDQVPVHLQAELTQPPPRVPGPITVHVGDGVRLVLVDGLRHDERPIVTDEDHRTIEMVLTNGDTLSFAVGTDLDGKTLPPVDPERGQEQPRADASNRPSTTPPHRPAPRRPAPSPKPASKPRPTGSKPAFVSPYQ